uniref:Nudix hydrolase domain-containing protein n=1 Tax=Aotus nancymaae TaxID=37293 RepID=A0A2K5D524_AOTNA
MKFKPNQRTYDRQGFKKRAACLCFRSEQEDEALLVSSSRCPDQEVYEAGVKGKLCRLLGIFEQNQDRKHRTYVYVLTVTEILEDWEDSVNIGRKREWFKVEDAIKVLQCHKPVYAEYLEKLKFGLLLYDPIIILSKGLICHFWGFVDLICLNFHNWYYVTSYLIWLFPL